MVKLVLLRHGESHWNKENHFTGWTDVDLGDPDKARQAMASRWSFSHLLLPREKQNNIKERKPHV